MNDTAVGGGAKFRETLINAPAHVCDVILPKLIVENARLTASKAVLFASILCKIPIAAIHRFINQRFLSAARPGMIGSFTTNDAAELNGGTK